MGKWEASSTALKHWLPGFMLMQRKVILCLVTREQAAVVMSDCRCAVTHGTLRVSMTGERERPFVWFFSTVMTAIPKMCVGIEKKLFHLGLPLIT